MSFEKENEMFNKYLLCINGINDNHSAVTAANITAKSNKELGEKLESIAKDEIKSKDRVDIPLKEYLKMRERIRVLEEQNSRMGVLINRIGIPFEELDKIDPNTVNVYHNENPTRFTRRYQIIFDVEAFR
jgi:hypothetical protein